MVIKRAFFLDIDMTIYNGREVSQEDREAIRSAREAGHKVFINTARCYSRMPKAVREVEFDGFVTALGTYIVYQGQVIHNVIMPQDLVGEVLEYAFDKGLKLVIEEATRVIYVNQNMQDTGKHTLEKGENLWEKYPDAVVYKLFIREQLSEEHKKYFRKKGELIQCGFCSELTPSGCTKATGIKYVEDYLGIPHENTVAIGDSMNDADMIRYAAVGVAMGNSEEGLKEIAEMVTKPISEAGVAHAIRVLTESIVIT